MTRKIRVGVIGAGWWSGFAHLPAIIEHPDAELVAVCDRDPVRAERAAQLFGAPVATVSYEALLDLGLNAVIVATPQGAHYAPAGALLDSGIDVLVEKPLTLNPREAWDLVRRAERSGAHLHVGHTFPHSPVVQALRSAFEQERLGQLFLGSVLFATAVSDLYRGDVAYAADDTSALFAPLPTTYSDPATGGQLFSQLSHAVAVVLFTTGETTQAVAAFEQNVSLDVDLNDAVSSRTDSGALIGYTSTGAVSRNELRREEYRFFGSDGHALLDTVSGTLEIIPNAGRTETIRSPILGQSLSRAPASNLIDATLNRAPVLVTGSLGARVVDVLTAARESSRSGRSITVASPLGRT